MVRNYVRKTDRGLTYTREKLREAIEKVKSKQLSSYKAAILYNIPRSTLVPYLIGKRGKSFTLGKPPVLPASVEKTLAENLRELTSNGFNLGRNTFLELVGLYLTVNNVKNPFKSGAPGSSWLSTFEKRHHIQIKPLYFEFGRLKEKDVILIKDFYSTLESKMTELGLSCMPGQIWHIEEHSFCDRKRIPKKDMRYETMKKDITVITACNAEGRKAPMLTVVKGEESRKWMLGKHINVSHKDGMCRDVFRNYFMNTFLNYVDDTHPNLIIYDAKSSHIDINLIDDTRNNKITMVRIPASVESFGISITNTLREKWNKVIVSKREFTNAIADEFDSLDVREIEDGFRKAGVYPFECVCDAKFDEAQLQVYEQYKVFKMNHASSQKYDEPEPIMKDDSAFHVTLEPPEDTSYSTEVEIEFMSMTEEPQNSTSKAKFPTITVKKGLTVKESSDRLESKHSKLNHAEEKQLVNWIENNSTAGFTLTMQNLTDAIENIATDFGRIKLKSGISCHVEEFLSRHPELIELLESKEVIDIVAWIDRVQLYLKNTSLGDVLNDPKRIFGFGETGLNLGNDQANENLTVFATASADGNVQEPCVLFHLEEPSDPAISWTKAEYLRDYIIDSFYPWLIEHNVLFPVILFLERSTQINLTLSEFCKENHVVLIALPGLNLQPLNNVLKSLKRYWNDEKAVLGMLKNDDIATELVRRISEYGKDIEYSFKMSGLCPFNPNICYQKWNGGWINES